MWASSSVIQKSPDDFKKPIISQVSSEHRSLLPGAIWNSEIIPTFA